jgi:predicted regulator of Ras-like GTPase activity (Roadblock/LC7/MglB family)
MESLLRQLYTLPGVAGALVIGRDGLAIASLMDDARTEAHAAQGAAAFDALTRYTRHLALGAPRQVMLETGAATVILTEAGELLLLVEATADGRLGRLRLEAARIARLLAAQGR